MQLGVLENYNLDATILVMLGGRGRGGGGVPYSSKNIFKLGQSLLLASNNAQRISFLPTPPVVTVDHPLEWIISLSSTFFALCVCETNRLMGYL